MSVIYFVSESSQNITFTVTKDSAAANGIEILGVQNFLDTAGTVTVNNVARGMYQVIPKQNTKNLKIATDNKKIQGSDSGNPGSDDVLSWNDIEITASAGKFIEYTPSEVSKKPTAPIQFVSDSSQNITFTVTKGASKTNEVEIIGLKNFLDNVGTIVAKVASQPYEVVPKSETKTLRISSTNSRVLEGTDGGGSWDDIVITASAGEFKVFTPEVEKPVPKFYFISESYQNITFTVVKNAQDGNEIEIVGINTFPDTNAGTVSVNNVAPGTYGVIPRNKTKTLRITADNNKRIEGDNASGESWTGITILSSVGRFIPAVAPPASGAAAASAAPAAAAASGEKKVENVPTVPVKALKHSIQIAARGIGSRKSQLINDIAITLNLIQSNLPPTTAGPSGGQQEITTPTVSYKITPSVNSVDEGNIVQFEVTTTGVKDGTVLRYKTLGTVNEDDFTDKKLSDAFTINSNKGSFSRSLSADRLTESSQNNTEQNSRRASENFSIEIRTIAADDKDGPVVVTSPTITVNDTSITIGPDNTVPPGGGTRPPAATDNQTTTQVQSLIINLESTSFRNNSEIASSYKYNQRNCLGSNTSPQLSWSITGDTSLISSFRLLCNDRTVNFVHWSVTNIDANIRQIAENGDWPNTATIQQTGWGGQDTVRTNGWGGPCPPAGETHTYEIFITAHDRSGARIATSNVLRFLSTNNAPSQTITPATTGTTTPTTGGTPPAAVAPLPQTTPAIASVANVVVLNPGSGFLPTDTPTVTNGSGASFRLTLTPLGGVANVEVITPGHGFTTIPEFEINSDTGVGAKFRVELKFTPLDQFLEENNLKEVDQKQIVQIIDCITK